MAHIYDYAIIGSGLTGLSIAAGLSKETQNIALIEAADHSFGSNKTVQFPTGPLNNGIRFVPDSVSANKAMKFVSTLLGVNTVEDTVEAVPVTYENGQFKSFLGFGDNPPAFYEELNYFTTTNRLNLTLEPFEWTQMLMEKFKGDFMPRSYVTRFHQEDNKVSHVTINGSKTIYANNFIFTGSVKDLAILLPDEVLSIRAKSKLAKNNYWNALCLDICHSNEVTTSEAVHVLNGTTQDEIGPCAGKFLPAVDIDGQKLQASQWITFLEHEVVEDSEIVGTTLKKIKRQIKRAYPEALENIKIERIFVTPIISGKGDLKLNANLSLPKLQNLWISSATMNAQKNLVGALLQAEMTLSALGFTITDNVFDSNEAETMASEKLEEADA